MTTMIAQEDALLLVDTPKITSRITFEKLVGNPNVAELLSKQELDDIGRWVVCGYDKDTQSRIQWTQRNAEAIKLALQVVEVKNFPWTNCSNVKFPLVTIGALQFLARIALLTKGRRPVKLEALGQDPEGKLAARAKRISEHMSLQIVDEDMAWSDEDEKMKLAAAILGSGVKKSFFDPVFGRNVTEHVPAQNFVWDYYAKHIDTCSRFTHYYTMSPNKIAERERRGLFSKIDYSTKPETPSSTNLLQVAADETQGTRPNYSPEEFEFLEQHGWLDIDRDGYAEPYVFYVRKDTGQVARIAPCFLDAGDVYRKNDFQVRQAERRALDARTGTSDRSADMVAASRFEREAETLEKDPSNVIVRIQRTKYFTQYTFIPSPDGGNLGLGLGALLGPVNETVNTLINQLIDAGTMSNSGGGFLGRGVKLKGGKTSFDPFEWKPADSTGDDLRKNIFPLPVREPSAVLFNLLGLLIQYGEKIASATDAMTGVNPGQNTPAETSRNTVEQGMMLFSGIYNRMYRAFREELTVLYGLNKLFLKTSPRYFELTEGESAILAPGDYDSDGVRVFPSADPSAVSSNQRQAKADKLAAALASTLGGGMDTNYVKRYWLEAHDYDDVNLIFPDPQGPKAVKPQPDPKTAMAQAKMQQDDKHHQDDMQLEVARLKMEMDESQAKTTQLMADAAKKAAEAQSAGDSKTIALIDAQLGAMKLEHEKQNAAFNRILQMHQTALKQREVDLKDKQLDHQHQQAMRSTSNETK